MSGSGDGFALVLSGGGSKGALQAGLHRALCELGLTPELIVGTSVGALNGALIASGVGPKTMARGWGEIERGALFRFDWTLLWKGLSGEGLFSDRHFRRFLEERLPASRFEELRIPLLVVSTHLSMGSACLWDEGDLVTAVQASCAVPGLLPPVRAHGGVPHVDGSMGDNLPVRRAREAGIRRVVAMNCRTCDQCDPMGTSLPEVLGRAFGIAADCSVRVRAEEWRDDPDVLFLQPEMGERIYALDFSQSARLVQAGYEFALPRLESWVAARTG